MCRGTGSRQQGAKPVIRTPSGRVESRLVFVDSCQRDVPKSPGRGSKGAIGGREQSQKSIFTWAAHSVDCATFIVLPGGRSESSTPSISASGRRRCRASGRVAHREGANLSDAAGPSTRRLCAGRLHGYHRAPDRHMAVGASNS
jgi:hypothetical protein